MHNEILRTKVDVRVEANIIMKMHVEAKINKSLGMV